ncbi:hypothetical protein PEC301879_34980 [Pectobacterium carotovorum subsp. carotovorum]|nr:hypothetical protein PEC301879_34980 [Pectobacterium carotovorum subsp. carotovorum]
MSEAASEAFLLAVRFWRLIGFLLYVANIMYS